MSFSAAKPAPEVKRGYSPVVKARVVRDSILELMFPAALLIELGLDKAKTVNVSVGHGSDAGRVRVTAAQKDGLFAVMPALKGSRRIRMDAPPWLNPERRKAVPCRSWRPIEQPGVGCEILLPAVLLKQDNSAKERQESGVAWREPA